MHLKIKLIIKISRNLKYNYSTLHSLAPPLKKDFAKNKGGKTMQNQNFIDFQKNLNINYRNNPGYLNRAKLKNYFRNYNVNLKYKSRKKSLSAIFKLG